MPSTYNNALRLEEIANGEQPGQWGTTTNKNLAQLIVQAITGTTDLNVTSGNITLTSLDGLPDESRSAVLSVTGTPGVTRVLTIPNVTKLYTVKNATANIVQVKTAAGAAFDCPPLSQSYINCNGAGVVTGRSITDAANAITSSSAPFASPALTGTPTAPTAAVGTNTTQIATTAFVNAEIANDVAGFAPLASPALTGTPTAPTAAVGTNTTQLATTAFVNAEIANDTSTLAPKASPTFTGTVTAANLTASGNIVGTGNWTIGNADTDTVTVEASFVTGSVLRSAKAATNTLALAAYDVDGAAYTNLVTLTASNTPTLALTSTGVGTINNMSIGATTASTVVATQVDITAQGDLRLQDTTGGQYVALQAPGTIATSYTLTLPTDDGGAGQALVTDGSGVLSWATPTLAANVTITTSSTSSAFKVPFADTTISTSGNYGLLQDSTATFTYNPSTNTLTAVNFSGALAGNATTATTLQTTRTINGVNFNGSGDITVTDDTKLPLTGGTLTGAITFDAGQTWPTFNQNTTGNAATATTLQTTRTINGVNFNGSANITVTANTTNTLTRGSYLTGSNFNGGSAVTWAVDADSANTVSKVVARDASGNFSAGTITASLTGTATNATQLNSVAASSYAQLGTTQTFTGNKTFTGSITSTAYNLTAFTSMYGDATNLTFSVSASAVNNVMNINSSGNFFISGSDAEKASGTAWINPSDSRLKNNVINYTKGLNELVQIQPKSFTFNGKAGSIAGLNAVGIIADEIEQVLPSTVQKRLAKLNPDDAEQTEIRYFDSSELTWVMINAIKELKNEVDSLKTQLATFKNQG